MHTLKETNTQDAFNKAAALCSASECCPMDIRQKLRKWGLDEQECDTILNQLIDDGFINEERYCRAFVHDKFHYNKWGRRKIQEALRIKHLPMQAIADALQQIPVEQYEETLKKLLTAKNKEIKAGTAYERNGKLMRFALERGFETAYISRFLPECDHCDDI
ncbi:MAG: RecX family transcriptional regulator [Clostridium sp.]|nr:RecX family transcriptional regulator [Clostridium sp.]